MEDPSEAIAVGSEEWVTELLPPKIRNVRIERVDVPRTVAEDQGVYAAYAPKRSREDMWRELQS